MGTRYVVARHCFGGIGDHLSCLIGAWWLARRTNRTLVVDWRGSRFNADPTRRHNSFLDFFELRQTLGGVTVIADDSVNAIEYPTPILPNKWTQAILAGPEHMKHTAEELAVVNPMVTSNVDPLEPTVVLNQWIEPPPPRAAMKEVLGGLRPVDSIRAEAQQFWNEHVGTAPAVAIHIRHGNGENVGWRAAYWLEPIALMRQLAANSRNDVHRPGLFGRFSDNMPPSLVGTPSQAGAEQRFYRQIATELHRLSSETGMKNAVPFLFCDAAQVVEGMRRVLPTLVVRPKRFLEQGTGPLHQLKASSIELSEYGGIRNAGIESDVTREMFLEIELMRRCEGLVYMDSGFSVLALMGLDENHIALLRPNLTNRLIVKAMSRLVAL